MWKHRSTEIRVEFEWKGKRYTYHRIVSRSQDIEFIYMNWATAAQKTHQIYGPDSTGPTTWEGKSVLEFYQKEIEHGIQTKAGSFQVKG